ncbi:MAG: hypothetical protein ACHQUB_01075 [Candidatus Saccharimonadia bacterium]
MISIYLKPKTFPSAKQIVHFEGYYGPDGIKVKSPGKDDPSHFYDPITDTGELPEHVQNHYDGLVNELREKDLVRAAFEASWLAHYVVDGLTPAHHYPFVEKIVELREGSAGLRKRQRKTDEPLRNDATTTLHKGLVIGDSVRHTLQGTWGLWGGKGVMSTHVNFEFGVATTLLFYKMHQPLDETLLAKARQLGMMAFFKQECRKVAELDLYVRFYREGWTAEMARIVREQIAPHACQVVGIIWMLAYLEADEAELLKPLSVKQ